jgi:hypothetical protein
MAHPAAWRPYAPGVLPDSLDPADLRNLSLAGIALVALAVVATLRFIQKLVLRLVVVAVLVVLGASLWVQRDELSSCRTTGSCTFFGQDVHVPTRDGAGG